MTHFPVFGSDSRIVRERGLDYGEDAQEARIQFINMEVDLMRELSKAELVFVAGGNSHQCTPSDSGNEYGGVSDTGSFGDDLINLYEGAVRATSHIIERVANAL